MKTFCCLKFLSKVAKFVTTADYIPAACVCNQHLPRWKHFALYLYTFKKLLNIFHIYLFSQGNLKPDEASKVLSVFEGRFSRLKEERDNLRKAKEALELSQPEHLSASDDRMQVGLEELQDLKVSVE